MMFFQVALLAGYGYAHLVTRVARTNRQFWIHGAVIAAGFAFVPLGVVQGWIPPTDHSPVLWLVGLLAVSVGGRSLHCRHPPRCFSRGSPAVAIA